MRLIAVLTVIGLFSVTLVGQTTNLAGANEMTINGAGAGGTSCIVIDGISSTVAGNHTLNMGFDALPNSPIITATAAACQINSFSFGPGCSLDIQLASLAVLVDGLNPVTAWHNTGPWGQTLATIPNVVTGPVSVQSAFLNPGFISGLCTSAAFTIGRHVPQPCNQGTAITLGDDAFSAWNLNWTFSFYGTAYTDCYVGSNGFITFGAGATGFTETVTDFLSGPPRIAMWWDDLNPTTGGTITCYTNNIGQGGACFTDVPEFVSIGANSFNCLFTSVNVIISYANMTSVDAIVGVSPGGNIDPTGTVIDVSSPADQGPFAPNTASYQQFGGSTPRDFGYGLTRQWQLDGSGNPIMFKTLF